MSNQPKAPRDCLGNEITKDSWFALHFDRPLVFKVVAVEDGGLHTSNGITPAMVRLVCDVTLRNMPGLPFIALVKVVDPTQQQLLDIASSKLPL